MNHPDPRTRILYVCHDGDMFGSQQSLSLIVSRAEEHQLQPFVSIARPGPLNEMLESQPEVTVLSHARLQWVKHDKRSIFQRMGDVIGLLVSAWPRAAKLAGLIKKHRIQLVHTNSMVSLEGGLAAWLAGVPHIWHVRELFMEENPKLNMVLGRRLTRWLISALSKQVICNSAAVRTQFGPYLKDESQKFRVVYNAVDIPAQIHGAGDQGDVASRPFRIGYVGRLSEGKRFHDLLEAMSRLSANDATKDAKLVVAGRFVDDPFEARIKGMIADQQLDDQVEFLGYVNDLAPVYQSMDVLVLPSLNEPFGRVLIEAMLAGVPCIAANSGGVPEIIQDGVTGLLFTPKDVDALAEKLALAMREPELLQSLRESAGRGVRERFTIDVQMQTLRHCYESALQ